MIQVNAQVRKHIKFLLSSPLLPGGGYFSIIPGVAGFSAEIASYI